MRLRSLVVGALAAAFTAAIVPFALAAFGGKVKAGGDYGGGTSPRSTRIAGKQVATGNVLTLSVADDAKTVTVYLDGSIRCRHGAGFNPDPSHQDLTVSFDPVTVPIRRNGRFAAGAADSKEDDLFSGEFHGTLSKSFRLRGRFDAKGRARGRLAVSASATGSPKGKIECGSADEPFVARDPIAFPHTGDARFGRGRLYVGESTGGLGGDATNLPMSLRLASRGSRIAAGTIYVPYRCEHAPVTEGSVFWFLLERFPTRGIRIRGEGFFTAREDFSFTGYPGASPSPAGVKAQATLSLRGRFPAGPNRALRGTYAFDIRVTDRATGQLVDTCSSGPITYMLSR